MPPAEPTPPVIGRTEALRLVLISGFAYQYTDDHGWMRGRYTDEHLRAADAAPRPPSAATRWKHSRRCAPPSTGAATT